MTTAAFSWHHASRRLSSPPRLDAQGSAPTWRLAARDTATVSSGMVAFGLVLGISVRLFGRDAFATLVGAATVFGGSAQLTSLTLLRDGSGLALAVASGAVVNLRLLLYSAAMGDRFAGQPRVFRWLAPHLIIDQTFLMSQTRRELVGAAFRRYWLWLGSFVLAVWMGSVAAGLLLAPVLPPLPHLALICTAMFVGLLVPRLTTPPAITAAVVGGASAALVSAAAPALGIVAGAVTGVLAGILSQRSTS